MAHSRIAKPIHKTETNILLPINKFSELIAVLFGVLFLGFAGNFIHDDPVPDDITINRDSLRIGLLVSADPASDPLSLEAVHAVQLAVNKTNNTGGINGRFVELIVKSSDADWGAGAKKSVDLIYDDEVAAIIGSLNGQNAHLVEMAVAKAQVVFISTRATDPTLSGANIPWFFRVIPNDIQQAEQLSGYIYNIKNLERLSVVSSDLYDHKMAAETFLWVSQENGHPKPEYYSYDINKPDFDDLVQSLPATNPDGISFYGYPEHLKSLIHTMKSSKIQIPVFAPLSILDTAVPSLRTYISSNVTHICPDNRFHDRAERFKSEFEAIYGYKAGNIAAYSYDGVNVLLESFKRGAYESESITRHLTGLIDFQAVTGDITFLENGDVKDITTVCQ